MQELQALSTRIERCRGCRGEKLREVFSLGVMPLANAFLERPDDVAPALPLELVQCEACSLVQITETVSAEIVFRAYLYRSSFSTTMMRHAEALTKEVLAKEKLGPGSLALEIASNDGYLLQNYVAAGVRVLGIDPAENLAAIAEQNGVKTVCEFFGKALGQRLRDEGVRADVIHGHNVLAHVADLRGLVEGIALVLAERGVAVIEVPYLRRLIECVAFDTIYHEHLCYFSLTALVPLFASFGLAVEDVQVVDIHGGSLRLWLRHAAAAQPRASVAAMLADEEAFGLAGFERMQTFGAHVEQLCASLVALLESIRAEGKRVAAYGAAAKGTVLLNYAKIDTRLVEFVVDKSPLKQGRWVPGVRVPIYAPEELVRRRPDYTLILTWNIKDEIVAQEAEYAAGGGGFIVAVPAPRVLAATPPGPAGSG